MKPTVITIHGINSNGGWFSTLISSFAEHFDHIPIRYREFRSFGAIKLLLFPGIVLFEIVLLELFDPAFRWLIISGALAGVFVGYAAISVAYGRLALSIIAPWALTSIVLCAPFFFHEIFGTHSQLSIFIVLLCFGCYLTYLEFDWHRKLALFALAPMTVMAGAAILFYSHDERLALWILVFGLLIVSEVSEVMESDKKAFKWIPLVIFLFSIVGWLCCIRFGTHGAIVLAFVAGFFSVVEPCVRRERGLTTIFNAIEEKLGTVPGGQRFILAHSLGSFLLAHGLQRYPNAMKPNRILLIGSVVPTDFDWNEIGTHSLEKVRNEKGMKDLVVRIAGFLGKCIPMGIGPSGIKGFCLGDPPDLESLLDDSEEFWQNNDALVYNVAVRFKHNDWSWLRSHARSSWLAFFFCISYVEYERFLDLCRKGYRLLDEIRKSGLADVQEKVRRQNRQQELFRSYDLLKEGLLGLRVVPDSHLPDSGEQTRKTVLELIRSIILLRLADIDSTDELIEAYLDMESRTVENIYEVIRSADNEIIRSKDNGKCPKYLQPRRALYCAVNVAWHEFVQNRAVHGRRI